MTRRSLLLFKLGGAAGRSHCRTSGGKAAVEATPINSLNFLSGPIGPTVNSRDRQVAGLVVENRRGPRGPAVNSPDRQVVGLDVNNQRGPIGPAPDAGGRSINVWASVHEKSKPTMKRAGCSLIRLLSLND